MTLLFLILRRAVVLCTFMQETETWEGSLPKNIEAFQHADTIIVNAAGCGCMLKEYPELFREEEQEWLEKAEVFAKKSRIFQNTFTIRDIALRRRSCIRALRITTLVI